MASPKMNLCLVLTLITMALHRAESQDCDEFTTVPMDTIAVMNSYTCLTCDYPGGTSQGWFRDGTIIQGDTTLCDCEVFPEDGRICFNSVTEADADTYSCEAIVGFGQVRACTADLILAEPPVIDESNTASLIVTEGNTATIPVSVAGLPSPTVQFMKDGAVLSSSSDSRVTISNTDSDWELTITNVDREDRGDYSIIATNSAGEDTFSRRLLVQFTPVLMVEQSAVDNNMITLTCTAIAYPQPFQNYVRWERVSDGIPLDTTQIFTETDIDFTVTITADVDVSTCEPEGYRCVVNNTRGTTKRSVTLCSGPPNPPAITVTVEGSTSVRVTWGRVTNPLAANYTIEYRPVGDNGAYMNRTVLEDGSASYSETIGGLIQGREYDFRAVSANSAGRSSFSQPRTVQLSSGDPVTGVSVVSTAVDDERAISITWNRYPDAVTAYRILYTLSGETKPEIIVEPDETSYLFRPVECGITVVAYTFQIQAVTSLGEERLSRRVPLEVDCTIPPFPSQAVTVQDVEVFGTAITVKWEVTDGTDVDGLVIRVSEIGSSGNVKVVNNYTVPRRDFVVLSKCVGRLMTKTTYEVCIVANISSRVGEEIDCYDPVVNTLEEDREDVSTCAQQTTVVEVSDRLEDSSSSGGIADWVIAVIVVGVLAMVALVFCLMGVFFACHTSQSKGGANFGSQSSIHTESLSSNMHMQNPRSMSPTRSCLSYHSKGHSTNWNDHVDTLRALESGVATSV